MKRRIVSAGLCLALLCSLNACYTIKYVENGDEVQDSKRIVYLLWGGVPVSGNNVKTGQKLQEKFTFVDYLITFVTLGIVSSRTVEAQ